MIRLDKLLSSRGYCSRSDVRELVRKKIITVAGEHAKSFSQKVLPEEVLFDGEPLDPGTGMVVMLNKPADYVCNHKEGSALIYELLPDRWNRRNPKMASAGRLDKDTTGLLLLTDDGEMLQRLTSPKRKLSKVYEVVLEKPLDGTEAGIFASGTLMLEGEEKPLKPAVLECTSEKTATLSIVEGRYHQVKRMFEAVGNRVVTLHRSQIGGLKLGDLAEGSHIILNGQQLAILFSNGDDGDA